VTDSLTPVARRQDADIALLFRTLAVAIAHAGADLTGDDLITTGQSADILRAVDRGLDVIFGAYPGDPYGALRTVVVRDTALARFGPLDAAVRGLRRAMPKELRDLVDAEVRP
jgi:hypothetical protein